MSYIIEMKNRFVITTRLIATRVKNLPMVIETYPQFKFYICMFEVFSKTLTFTNTYIQNEYSIITGIFNVQFRGIPPIWQCYKLICSPFANLGVSSQTAFETVSCNICPPGNSKPTKTCELRTCLITSSPFTICAMEDSLPIVQTWWLNDIILNNCNS